MSPVQGGVVDDDGAPNVIIRQVTTAADLDTVTRLFTAYAESLGIDLAFQSYATELASLPGAYEAPKGALLLAVDGEETPLGCMGVRSIPYGNHSGLICEAKRLYVTPEGRGKGVGSALLVASISASKAAGYEEMKLDTLANMVAAQQLYRRFGFVQTEPYYQNPHEDTIYMSLDLRK